MARLRARLGAVGMGLSEDGSASAYVTTAQGSTLHPELPSIVVYDGRLSAHHVPVLTRRSPALLLAAREGENEPSSWELGVLGSVIAGQPLTPSGPALPRVKHTLGQVDALQKVAHAVREWVISVGATRSAADLAADLVHELGANALLDAPVDEDGQPKYAHRRDANPAIDPGDACELNAVVSEGRLYLEAVDRFGRLTSEPWARVVSTLGQRATIQSEGGGAGLGLRRMIEHSDLVAARVRHGRETRVLCVLDLGEGRRRASGLKSLLFWSDRG